jgi:hypothetical protein
MKNVLLVLGMLSMMGCAVGSNDPTGDVSLGTEQGGEATGEPGSSGGSAASSANASDKQTGSFARTNVLDPTPQIIPGRTGHGPASPSPGPVHIDPNQPR